MPWLLKPCRHAHRLNVSRDDRGELRTIAVYPGEGIMKKGIEKSVVDAIVFLLIGPDDLLHSHLRWYTLISLHS